ncbi:hypothetical protein Rhe02_07080 [Rhizocola hellebori]|uniref:Uncharacterized protein n=1 Tax=Rhizocola hellebori TaxID=1392758 RepID=A0A8J3Q2V5_9ACTN|nr:hypothetical protein [Rhizocola hellebori]GIH02641.1 hypothetical protein Rhe02_07080 [Rhizocola hellebori]
MVVSIFVAGCSEAADPQVTGPDVGSYLECGGMPAVNMVADRVGDARETRTPAEMASAFAAVQKGAFSGSQKVALESGARQDIIFVNSAGKTTAVMSYEHSDSGWQLAKAISCSASSKGPK